MSNPALSTFSYYTTQSAAQVQDNLFLIANPDNYLANNGVAVWVRAVNRYKCVAIVKISIAISATQLPTNYSKTLSACDDFINTQNDHKDGFTSFDFNSVTNNLLSILPLGGNFEIKYYRNKNDFDAETDATGASLAITNINNYRNTGYPNQQTIWIKVISTIDNRCYGFGKLFLKVAKAPTLVLQPQKLLCANSSDFITLSSGLSNQEIISDFGFRWFLNNIEITSQNTSNIDINQIGVYTCLVTNLAAGCAASSSQIVKDIEPPTKLSLAITDLSTNNLVLATATGSGEFEYAIDIPDGFYQKSPFFENVSPGFHVFYARNILGCEPLAVRFAVVGIMPFFTPNQDSYNDFWQIEGIGKKFNSKSKVQIFDRFGKLLYEIQSGDDQGWDGTLNGSPLPADDYWFTLSLEDGRVASGHFSLKR